MKSSEALGRVVSNDPAILNFCDVMKDVPVQYVDQSSKIKVGSISSDRILTYVPSHKISFENLWSVLKGYNAPNNIKATLEKNYYRSKNLGICLEKKGDKNNFRIYTEYHIPRKQYENLNQKMVFKHLTVDSFKWDVENPEGIKKTFYESLIAPTYNNIKLAMHMAKVKFLPAAVNRKLRNAGNEFTPTYLVTDNITQRSAVDIKFDLNEELQLNSIKDELTLWSKKNIETQLKGLDMYPIHHVSLGIDADEKDYVTLYFKL